MLEGKGLKIKKGIDFIMRLFNLVKLNKKNQTKKINELETRIENLEFRLSAIFKINEYINGK